jgi:hypothetical protein
MSKHQQKKSSSNKATKKIDTEAAPADPSVDSDSPDSGAVENADTEAQNERLLAAQTLVRQHVVQISQQCNTPMRAVVDRYLPSISRQHASEGSAALPRTVEQHPVNPERCRRSRLGDLLCFHIGNTLLAYYAAVASGDTSVDPLLEYRLQFLQKLNECGIRQFVAYGSDSQGWTLMHIDDARKQVREDEQKAESRRLDRGL